MKSAALPRLAIVLSHPIQYYSPWFRWLSAHTELTCRVFYLWDFGVSRQRDPQFGVAFAWDVDLLSGYDAEFVANTSQRPGTDHFGGLRNPTLLRRLEAWKPGAVLLFGYRSASHLRVIRWARRQRIPLVFRGDSHLLGRGRPPWPRRWLMAWVYRQFAAITYVGAANRDYFLALGVPAGRMFFAPHAVDPARFDPSDPATLAAARELRAQLGLSPDRLVVVFAAKLVAAKQPRELLEAFLELRPERAALVIVGDGAELPQLAAAARLAPPGTVHLLPFANQSEMPARYRLGDLFVLPSRGRYETWGLAVNEAMQLGVPCLVSDRVGCQQDLVTPGETGWVFRANEPGDLKAKLGAALGILRDPAARERYRRAVMARIGHYSYTQATSGLLQALASLP